MALDDISTSQIIATAAIANTAAPAKEFPFFAAAPVNVAILDVLVAEPPTGAAGVLGAGVGCTTTTEVMVDGVPAGGAE
jgi:hypothetical protein